MAKEHAAVGAWVEDAFRTLGEHRYYQDIELKSLPSGDVLLQGNGEQSRRFVMAAVAQAQHWDGISAELRSRATNDFERMNSHHLPGWSLTWGRRRQAVAVINALMRRNLPFNQADLLTLLDWCCDSTNLSSYNYPIGALARTLQRYASANSIDQQLRATMRHFVNLWRSSHDKDAKRFATVVDQLCSEGITEPPELPNTPKEPKATPNPAGSPHVLNQLKHALGMQPEDLTATPILLEPDQFPMSDQSPLRHEHELLSAFYNEVVGTPHYSGPDLEFFEAGRKLLSLQSQEMGRALIAAIERHVNTLFSTSMDLDEPRKWQSHYTASSVARTLMNQDFELDRDGLFDFMLYLSILPSHLHNALDGHAGNLLSQVAEESKRLPLTEGERYVLTLFRAALVCGPALGSPPDAVSELSAMINDGASFYLVPGEAWTDSVNDDLPSFDPKQRTNWSALFKHALTASSSRPSAKWLKTADGLVQAIGPDHVRDTFLKWFPLVTRGRTIRKFGHYAGDTRGGSDTMQDENATCLRGLLWCVTLLAQQDDLTRAVTSVALSAYKKVPGVGPRAVKVGNGAIYALSEIASKEAVGQLAMLKVRVKFGTAQKEIEKAFDAAATALNLPRDQIEELGIPAYGMEDVGHRLEEFGNYRAELVVTGSDTELKWTDSTGKLLKSIPAKVKNEFKEDLKELQQSLKDIQSMLPAQRDRIDGLFLLQKSWSISEWRERYHDHPLVGTIGRRLIWCLDGIPVIFTKGVPCTVRGEPIEHGKTAEITLWHPVGRSIEDITGWRRRLEELGVTQPFKQAYRELYPLTDAERNTRTYSNRYAAHILRQHQFNALCAARGWKNKLRLMVDDSYPPATKELPLWGLRAEFWIEGIGDNYGGDTNDAGVYLRLATDQVRFYRSDAALNHAHAGGGGSSSDAVAAGQNDVNVPLSLDQVPPLVFSEIMRDVDLFVGVASVGNDPTWQDGGPQARYQTYWQSYSFGELSGTATTRKQVLERLVPKLKIAKRCSFTERFLVVRGDKRTYKIHLGSGNILMEPNDQYLCIVPDAKARATQEDLYLPFEGDSTLSIILSKAILLADDTKIKDPTITRQIDGL